MTRLPLADELAFVIVMVSPFLPVWPPRECCRAALRPSATPRRQAVGNQAQLALKEFDPCEHTAIVAEAVFVERGVNLFGQPKWVVTVIFDTGVRVPTWW